MTSSSRNSNPTVAHTSLTRFTTGSAFSNQSLWRSRLSKTPKASDSDPPPSEAVHGRSPRGSKATRALADAVIIEFSKREEPFVLCRVNPDRFMIDTGYAIIGLDLCKT